MNVESSPGEPFHVKRASDAVNSVTTAINTITVSLMQCTIAHAVERSGGKVILSIKAINKSTSTQLQYLM